MEKGLASFMHLMAPRCYMYLTTPSVDNIRCHYNNNNIRYYHNQYASMLVNNIRYYHSKYAGMLVL
jgi:hypothetical protein